MTFGRGPGFRVAGKRSVSMVRRTLMVVLGAAVAAQAVALCGATGWAVFTRYPSADLERMNSDTTLERAFSGTGLNDKLGEMDKIESQFAFGWLPVATWSPEALSVATLGGPGALLVLVGLWPRRSGGRESRITHVAEPTSVAQN
jgi:hypothetical protein